MKIKEGNVRLTKIILPEDGITMPIVERELNGITVSQKSVRAADLMKVLISSAEEFYIFDAMIKGSNEYYNMFEKMVSFSRDYGVDIDAGNLFEEVFNFLRDEATQEEMTTLFRVMCERIAVANLDMNAYNQVAKALMADVQHVSDPETLGELTRTLLQKIGYFDSPDKDLLKSVLDVLVKQVKDELVKDSIDQMWSFLAERVSKKTVLTAAKPFMDELEVATPVLPRNCLFYRESKTSLMVAIEVEKRRWDVNLGGDIFEQCGHPGLVFFFVVNRQSGNVSPYLFAVKDTVLKEESRLYRYPFSNVHEHNGSCCWPNLPKVKHLRQLESFPAMFMDGERNFHLYPKTGDMEYRELLVHLSGRDFDPSLLQETKFQIKDFIDER